MQIKCKQSNCEVCGKLASIQVFYNKSGEMKYGRARHYVGRVNNKPKFVYHQQSLGYLIQIVGPVIGQVHMSDLASVSQNTSISNTTLLSAEQQKRHVQTYVNSMQRHIRMHIAAT
jgi:hypothetical protein